MADEPIQRFERETTDEGARDQAQDQPPPPPKQARVIESGSDEDERYRGATPPGYDWPTHGGYLGCLLGVMIACLLAPLSYILFGFVGAFLIHPLGGIGVALSVIVTVAAYLAVFVALTRLGWRMGKRFLREYEQPVRPVWGEDDDDDYPLVVEADPPVEASATESPAAEESTAKPAPPQPENAG